MSSYPVSTTAASRAVKSSGVTNALQQRPLEIIDDQDIPTDATDGYGITTGALSAQLFVGCRLDPSKRRAWGAFSSYVAGDTYRATINGTAVTYASGGGDTEAQALAGLKAAIEASGTLDALVTVEQLDSWRDDSTVPALYVVGKDDTDWVVLFDTSSGTGVMATYAEPTEATVDIYVRTAASTTQADYQPSRYNGDGLNRWGAAAAATSSGRAVDIALDVRNMAERMDVSGFAAVYPRFYDMAGPSGETSVTYVPFSLLVVGTG